jgi:raffinose/stachyose/melibiose transport system permease protein
VSSRTRAWRHFSRQAPLLIVVVGLAAYFFLSTLPAILGVGYSFTNSDGISQGDFVGLRNFGSLLQDPKTQDAYFFTIRHALVCTIIANVLSLAIAVGLNAKIGAQRFFRGIFFLPNVFGPLILGYIFGFLFAEVLPQLGEEWSIEFLKTNILTGFETAWLGIAFVAIWQSTAFSSILYLAGLQSVPEELFDAAKVDGASTWRTFSSITLPLLAPFLLINIVLSTRGFLGVFDQVVALTDGGPGSATNSVVFQIYTAGFMRSQFGLQSANALIFTVLMLAVAALQFFLLRRRSIS